MHEGALFATPGMGVNSRLKEAFEAGRRGEELGAVRFLRSICTNTCPPENADLIRTRTHVGNNARGGWAPDRVGEEFMLALADGSTLTFKPYSKRDHFVGLERKADGTFECKHSELPPDVQMEVMGIRMPSPADVLAHRFLQR